MSQPNAHDKPAGMVSTEGSSDGWAESAQAWIAEMGEHGDWSRRYVLDAVMLERALVGAPANALDLGCGEGRFCRLLSARGCGRWASTPP